MLVFNQLKLISKLNPAINKRCLSTSKIFLNAINKNRKNPNLRQNRLNLPPSFRNSKPLPQNTLSDDEISKINSSASNNSNNPNIDLQPVTFKNPWWLPLLKISIVFIPMILIALSYIIYQTINNKTVFFPIRFNSAIPLENALGFENIDVDMLKSVSKNNLIRRLNMNHEIRNYFGLPITLGEYQSFDILIEYDNLAVEGYELDFRKSWFHPIVKFKEIETPILPPNINNYLQPLKVRIDNDIDESPDQNSMFLKDINYKIKIRATIDIINEKIDRIEPGSGKITFDAEVELDHTRLLKITGALMHFKNKGGSGSGGTLERLW